MVAATRQSNALMTSLVTVPTAVGMVHRGRNGKQTYLHIHIIKCLDNTRTVNLDF